MATTTPSETPGSYAGPERRTRDRSIGLLLRRREQRAVEVERRQPKDNGFDIVGALEMYLDECKTKHAMLRLLEGWLAEARNSGPDAQDPSYVKAVERAITVMREAPDLETGIGVLQRR